MNQHRGRHDDRRRTGAAAGIIGALLTMPLAGCGLAETGVTAAAEAKASADAAQEGLRTEARVRAELDQAQQAAAAQRQAVDAE